MIEIKRYAVEEVETFSDYILEFGYIGRSDYGIKEFHFQIHGMEENYFFFTYEDISGYVLTGKASYQPVQYIFLGKILSTLEEKIKSLVKEHKADKINAFADRMK